jgi:hypothetical protein
VRATRANPIRDKHGCQLEWHVVNPNNPLDKFGLPDRDQVCVDNDPTCDSDPTPGFCRFTTALCLNTTDPSLIACQPSTGITSVAVKPVPLKILNTPIVGALASANIQRIVNALGQLLDPQDPGAGYTKTIPLTASQLNVCSQPISMDVVAISTNKDKAKRRQVVRTVSKNGNLSLSGKPRPQAKRAMMRLLCLPNI